MKYILKFIGWAQVRLGKLFLYLRNIWTLRILKRENKGVVNTRITFKNYSKALVEETGDFTTDDMANFYTKGVGKKFAEEFMNKKPGGSISWQERELKQKEFEERLLSRSATDNSSVLNRLRNDRKV